MGLSLVYDGKRADGGDFLTFGVDSSLGSLSGDLLFESTSVGLGGFEVDMPGHPVGTQNLSGGENFWKLPTGSTSSEVKQYLDLSSLYSVDVAVGRGRLSSSGKFSGSRESSVDNFVHINGKDSPFGAGWDLAGLQRAIENYDGSVLIVDGDGSKLLFELDPATSGYKSPLGDFSKLEKSGSGFRRTLPNGRYSAQPVLPGRS